MKVCEFTVAVAVWAGGGFFSVWIILGDKIDFETASFWAVLLFWPFIWMFLISGAAFAGLIFGLVLYALYEAASNFVRAVKARSSL